MMRMTCFVAVMLAITAQAQAGKEDLKRSVQSMAEESWSMARSIWEFAEPGYLETRSSALIAERLEKAGFKLARGVAGIPTAFTATYGSGKPVIAILGEYDALPELSQEAVPVRQPRTQGNGYGQACGHHLFGVGSMVAAIAVADEIRAGRLSGTIRYYGCPAEEGGAAKAFMVRAGLFSDVDCALHWHPGSRNSVGDPSCLARIAVRFRFHGTAAHAAGSPERGRSALDALLLAIHGVELMREHTPTGTRMHHTILSGGGAANVVPEFAEGFFYVRHPQSDVVRELYPRLLKCAQAGALATETRLEVVPLGGTLELLPNSVLPGVIRANFKSLNKLRYDDAETRFAVRLRESISGKIPPMEDINTVYDNNGGTTMGSTDVGDVSWVVPTAGFSAACWAPGTPGHSWQAVACGGTTIGRKGMLLAADILAASAWDLIKNPALLEQAKVDFKRRLGESGYRPLMEKDQKPPLEYRLPARRNSSGE